MDHRKLPAGLHLKPLLGCRHRLTHNQNGIEIQTDCAIIACLEITLWTGRKSTKRTHEMICFHMMGGATTEEVEAHLAKWKLADDEAAKKRGFDTGTRLRPPQSESLNAARASIHRRSADAISHPDTPNPASIGDRATSRPIVKTSPHATVIGVPNGVRSLPVVLLPWTSI